MPSTPHVYATEQTQEQRRVYIDWQLDKSQAGTESKHRYSMPAGSQYDDCSRSGPGGGNGGRSCGTERWRARAAGRLCIRHPPVLPIRQWTGPPWPLGMEVVAPNCLSQIIGSSPEISRLRAFIPKLARSDCNVIITGETGTGKERVAQAIHANSSRSSRKFVAINSAALPDALLEAELFGYEKGAFTGALTRFEGRFKQADGGTLFLDEIGDMSLSSQAKILRAIEEREFYRVGSTVPQAVDVRVIAATNQDLPELVKTKHFRSDLYHRLNVVNIELPPLRQRRDDIPLLLDRYLREYNTRHQQTTEGPTPEALILLMRYDWPGNVRELKNLIERLLIDSPAEISLETLPAYFGTKPARLSERDSVLQALLATNWNKTQAAQHLSWSRMTLYRKMKKYNLTLSSAAPPLR